MNYLVTIKKNVLDFTSLCEIKEMYKRLFKGDLTITQGVELDSLQRLHLHSLVHYKRVPYYKTYMAKGWHIFFERISEGTEDVAARYIHKHSNPIYQEQMEITSYANYNYMFI